MATQGNWWENDEIVGGPSAAPPAPSYPGVIQGRVPQPTAIEQGRYDMDRSRFDIDQIRSELEVDKLNRDRVKENTEAERLARAQSDGLADGIAKLRRTIDAAQRAKNLSRDGWFTTGFGASAARAVGGTQATDVSSLLDVIASNAAFDRLQQMREESPTGGALGAVSERELQLLSSSITSLNQSQSDEQFQRVTSGLINRRASLCEPRRVINASAAGAATAPPPTPPTELPKEVMSSIRSPRVAARTGPAVPLRFVLSAAPTLA